MNNRNINDGVTKIPNAISIGIARDEILIQTDELGKFSLANIDSNAEESIKEMLARDKPEHVEDMLQWVNNVINKEPFTRWTETLSKQLEILRTWSRQGA